MKHLFRIVLGLILAVGLGPSAAGQARPYPSGDLKKTYERLLKQIDAIPMYDNHAHPGFADDIDVDAMAGQVDGKFMSAFIRAVKPATGVDTTVAGACCSPTCCS